jgi:predicted nucleotidyltransferase
VLLALFLGHPDQPLYLRETVRRAGLAHGAVQRELRRLTEAGVLRRTVQGRQTYYQANRDCPIFPELRGLLLKTTGLADVLRAALRPLAPRVRIAFVYGSLARGEAGAGSDVDLMVIGRVTFASVVAATGPAQGQLGREINPSVYPPDEFRKKLAVGNPFLQNVLNGPKLFVVGDARELAGLAQQRLADAPSAQRAGDRRPARGRRTRPRRRPRFRSE